jgi:CDP-diacylglycerol--glycerol-3-phosphate 3-phosphatidyltransferase
MVLNDPVPPRHRRLRESFDVAAATAVPRWIKPNHLSAGRLVLAAGCVALLLTEQVGWFMVAFALGLTTDLLDGAVARCRGQATQLGKLLDPIADKALTLPPLVWVAQTHGLTWLLAAIGIRELAVIVASAFALSSHAVVRSNLTGKLYLCCLGLAIFVAFTSQSKALITLLFGAAATLSLASLVGYLYRYARA